MTKPPSHKPSIEELERQQEKELHDIQMKLAKDLIENDEKNELWKKIERLGNFLSKKYYGWRGRWRL